MFHNRSIGMGVTWLITMVEGGKKLGVKESSWKEGEDWIEPVLNIHTPFSPTLNPSSLFVSLQLSSQKEISYAEKILEGGGIFTPPPQVTPVFIGYVKIECSEL
jgi:hypothetical protein